MTKIPKPVAVKAMTSEVSTALQPETKTKKLSTGQQIARMMQLLQRLPRERATEDLFREICDWAGQLPEDKRPDALSSALSQAFGKGIEEIDLVLKSTDRRVEFDSLVPTSGWIHEYIEWTRKTEPPTVFHFFVACVTIGAALARNVFFDKGAYQVFPNLCVMIIAPTGRCRKTSACNIGTGLYTKVGGTIIADKATPEALVDALKDSANATGLIYAPELAVFLGKQKYQEGMIPLLTSLLDCPKEWTSKTLGRGETTLTNVALSALMCSTIDWLQTDVPKAVFGGGFMSRFLFVVQESTSRSFPLPPPLDPEVRKKLTTQLGNFRLKKGGFTLTEAAYTWYVRWYNTRPSLQGDKQYAGYYERKPDHIIRLAMVMHIASHPTAKQFSLDVPDLIHADKVLSWMENWLPSTFDEMTANSVGEDQSRILRHLKVAGGTVEHSILLRKNSSKMNADQFKRALATLREAKLVEWDATNRSYTLTAEGWM
jgi:hypothetical protein